MLFPLNSLDELTDDGLHQLKFLIEQELEQREEAEYEQDKSEAEVSNG